MAKHPDKTCENCGKALFGRTDKRFCNDTCRNTYNRNKALLEQKKAHDNLPEIFKIIKRNYEILQSLGTEKLEYGSYSSVSINYLKKQGFNFRFCTSIHEGERAQVWKFCFEYGWLEGVDDVTLAFWEDQAEIEKPRRPSKGIPEFP